MRGMAASLDTAAHLRLLRLVNAPIREPVGSIGYTKRCLHRAIILRYVVGGEERGALAASLGLSLRQFHRDYRAAIEWMTTAAELSAPAPTVDPKPVDVELIVLERCGRELGVAETKRRFERLVSARTEPASRARALVAFYEFSTSADDRGEVASIRTALRAAVAAIDDERERNLIVARYRLADAHSAFRAGSFLAARDEAAAAAELARRLLQPDDPEPAITLCSALQLRAQLSWELGGGIDAATALSDADRVIGTYGLGTLPCAVSNAIGRCDVLMRDAAHVPNGVAYAARAFDLASVYGDADDATAALLISAMVHAAQRRFASAVEHVRYGLELVDRLNPVARAHVLAGAADVLIASGRFALASSVLDRAREPAAVHPLADARRDVRVGLLTHEAGASRRGLATVDQAIGVLEAKGARRSMGAALRIRARIRGALGDRLGAVADLERAVNDFRADSYAWVSADALSALAAATGNAALQREALDLRRQMGVLAS